MPRVLSQIDLAFLGLPTGVPEPTAVYAAGTSNAVGNVSFDAITVTPNIYNVVQNWLAKYSAADGSVVWATKIMETQGSNVPSSNAYFIVGSLIGVSDGVVVVLVSGPGTNGVKMNIYDTTSQTIPATTFQNNESVNVSGQRLIVIKYNKNGVYQWARSIYEQMHPGLGPTTIASMYVLYQSGFARPDDSITFGFIYKTVQDISHHNSIMMSDPSGASPQTLVADDWNTSNTLQDRTIYSYLTRLDAAGNLREFNKDTLHYTGNSMSGSLVAGFISNTATSRSVDQQNVTNDVMAEASYFLADTSGSSNQSGAVFDSFTSSLYTFPTDSGKGAIVKRGPALTLQWTAEVTQEVAPGNAAKEVEVTSVDVDVVTGDVYFAGFAQAPGGGTGTLTLRSAGWAAPDVQVTLQPDNASSTNTSIPFYGCLSTSGVARWLKTVGAGPPAPKSTAPFVAPKVTVINGKPVVVLTIGTSGGVVLDAGLGTQLIVDSGGANAPRGVLFQVDPTDGHVVTSKMIDSNAGGALDATIYAGSPGISSDMAMATRPPLLLAAPSGLKSLLLGDGGRAGGTTLVWGKGETNQTTLADGGLERGTIAYYDATTLSLKWARFAATSIQDIELFAVAAEKTYLKKSPIFAQVAEQQWEIAGTYGPVTTVSSLNGTTPVFTTEPALPTGMTINASTGAISGTPNGALTPDVVGTLYRVVATDPSFGTARGPKFKVRLLPYIVPTGFIDRWNSWNIDGSFNELKLQTDGNRLVDQGSGIGIVDLGTQAHNLSIAGSGPFFRKTGGPQGLPSMEFDGPNSNYLKSSAAFPTETRPTITVGIIFKSLFNGTQGNGIYTLLGMDDEDHAGQAYTEIDTTNFGKPGNSVTSYRGNEVDTLNSDARPMSNYGWVVVEIDGATSRLTTNAGIDVVNFNVGTHQQITRWLIGSYPGEGAFNTYYKGHIVDVIVYDGKSSTIRNGLISSFTARTP